jgi:hypothetical protein
MYNSNADQMQIIPTGLAVAATNNNQFGVIAMNSFSFGQTLFSGVKKTVVSSNVFIFNKSNTFVETIEGEKIFIIPSVHWVQVGTNEFDVYGFDSFMNHSCAANTYIRWDSKDTYTHIASRKINIGDEITVDYRTVYPRKYLPSFTCECGMPECDYLQNNLFRLHKKQAASVDTVM